MRDKNSRIILSIKRSLTLSYNKVYTDAELFQHKFFSNGNMSAVSADRPPMKLYEFEN